MVSAVDACVSSSAWKKPSRGRTTSHGGAKVAMLTAVTAPRATSHGHETSFTAAQTSR